MAWYEEFFDDDYMRFHLRGRDLTERTVAECDFVMQALGLEAGDRVLDLCCGQGRHSVELARRGVHVTGADLSEHLLGLAHQAAVDARVRVEFVRCDMRELPWENEFDAVIMMWTAFGYLESDEEDEKVLRAIHTALKPGGRMFFDMQDLWHRARVASPRRVDWYEFEDHLCLEEATWDVKLSKIHMNRIIIAPDGTRRTKWLDLRVYAHTEILAMLQRVGLQWEQTYGNWDMSEFTAESKGMFVVARKPEEEHDFSASN